MLCKYCNNELRHGEQVITYMHNHRSCEDEHKNRENNGMCVYCGKNKQAYNRVDCTDCKTSYPDYQNFQGYPGT